MGANPDLFVSVVKESDKALGQLSYAGICSQTLQDADTLVQNTTLQVTDPANQQRAILTVVNIISK
jgi:hypothetical protein